MDLSQTKVTVATSTGRLEAGSTATVVSSTSVVLNSRFYPSIIHAHWTDLSNEIGFFMQNTYKFTGAAS